MINQFCSAHCAFSIYRSKAHVWQNLECPQGTNTILALSVHQQILDILHLFSYCISHTIVHCVQIYTPYYTDTRLHSPFRLRIVLRYSCCRLYTCRPLRPSLQHFSPLPAVSLRSVSTTRVHGPSSRAENSARELGCISARVHGCQKMHPSWRLSTRPVNSGAFFDTRQLGPSSRVSKNAPGFTGRVLG